jgi:hypothetical protein
VLAQGEIKIKLRSLFCVLALAAALVVGCGDSEDFVFTNNNAVNPTGAFVTLNHVLARAVPDNIATYRVSGMDDTGNVLFGPEDFAKTADLTIGMPVQCFEPGRHE